MQKDPLVTACQAGDLAAFSELFQQYEAYMYRLSVTILHNEQDAEDIVQDASLKVFRKIDKYRGDSSFKTWLTHIVVNLCRDRLRRRKVRKWISLDWIRGKAGDFDIDTTVSQRQDRYRLWSYVKALEDKYRIPVVLHYYEHLPCNEIAEVLEITVSAVYARLNRARILLRTMSTKPMVGLIDTPTEFAQQYE